MTSLRRRVAAVATLLSAVLALAACSAPQPYLDLLEEFPRAEVARTPHTLDFGEPEARGFLGSGWSSQDESWAGGWSFVWATGSSSVVRFDVVGMAPAVVRFRARPAESPTGEQQSVTLVLNGTDIGTVDLTPGTEVYRVVIPNDIVIVGENELELRYAFQVDATEADSRDRTVAWDWLRLVTRDGSETDEGEPATAAVDEGALHLPLSTRVDYFVELRPDSVLVVEAAGSGNHPQAQLALETLGVDGSRLEYSIAGDDLATRQSIELGATGPVRLSLQAEADPSGRGIKLRAVRLESRADAPAGPPRSSAAVAVERPNVIVYLVDTLRADHLGTYGYGPPTSPELDAMGAEGVVFERMFAQSGWTRTSVASLMTGLNPLVHGVMSRDDALPEAAITLPVLMGDLGYETIAVITNGNVSGTFGFDQGFDRFKYLGEQSQEVNPEVHHLSDDVNAEFSRWLDGRAADQPFFAYLHTTDPHAPYVPREPYLEQFVGDLPRSGLDWPRYARAFVAGQDALSAEQVRDELVALYDAEIAFNDFHFGRLLDTLEERGLAENTVVIFTSDHGEEFLDHDGYGHGKTLYRELVQVPLVMRLPDGIAAGTRPTATVQHIDFLPTIVELAGGTVPEWAQGRSLVPAFQDEDWSPEVTARSYLELDISSVASVVSDDWHLLRSPMDGRHARSLGLELFDLASDPAELSDLRARQTVVAGLLLANWRRAEAGEAPLFAIDSAEIDEELAARLRDLGYIR